VVEIVRRRRGRRRRLIAYSGIAVSVVALVAASLFLSQAPTSKPVILYVNQGNGPVNGSNFDSMLSFASAHDFNTIFFQVYREGTLLFTNGELGSFASQAHAKNLKIFFSLYFTNSTQLLPIPIVGLGEDGVNLDMSSLNQGAQESLLTSLKATCLCTTAVTTTDMYSTLKPDLLILETYGTSYQQFIKKGVVGSVGVFTTASRTNYETEFQYALNHSDGVMVFDYAGLLRSGY
jgi:hypothetical protein